MGDFMKRFLSLIAAAAALAAGGPAAAYDAMADAKITLIELTYMPQSIVFQADRTIGSCAQGSMLVWTPQGATQTAKDQNAQAVLAAMMTAKVTGASMRLFVVNAGCTVQYIYLL